MYCAVHQIEIYSVDKLLSNLRKTRAWLFVILMSVATKMALMTHGLIFRLIEITSTYKVIDTLT